jgi:hypothetical protein
MELKGRIFKTVRLDDSTAGPAYFEFIFVLVLASDRDSMT